MARSLGNDWERLVPMAHYSAKELARLCQLSVRQLQRVFRRQFRCTPQNWLNEQRLRAAGPLLRSGFPVKVVALELGFKQTSHFCREFKSYHQITPSRFADSGFTRLNVVQR